MSLIIFCTFIFIAPAGATDLILINPTVSIQPSGVTGTITRIKKESLKIVTASGDKFEVELDDIDLDGRARNLFQEGQTVFVEGLRIDDDEIRAKRITVSETGREFNTGNRLFFGDLIVK